MTSAISVDGLVRRFDGVTAVDHVNLEVERGEITGFWARMGRVSRPWCGSCARC